MMQILVLQGPNLNMLGWISRQTGTRLTLDKLNRALRHTARELGVELKIYQNQSEVEASRIVQRQRNKVTGVLLIPGIWASSGHLLQETLAIAELPLAVFHMVMESGPWKQNSPSIFKDLARIEEEGMGPDELAGCLSRFAEQL
ncbi:type II 3-dehydroquinate dehydratase [Candidatus Neomarinimicrobiota bacterium]